MCAIGNRETSLEKIKKTIPRLGASIVHRQLIFKRRLKSTKKPHASNQRNENSPISNFCIQPRVIFNLLTSPNLPTNADKSNRNMNFKDQTALTFLGPASQNHIRVRGRNKITSNERMSIKRQVYKYYCV